MTPLTVALSQSRAEPRVDALRDGDCATATDAALGSLDALSSQAGAFEVLGWCDARAGQHEARGGGDAQRPAARPRQLALRLRAGGRRRRWRGRTRGRPRPQALRLNPLEPQTIALAAAAAARNSPRAGGRRAARLAASRSVNDERRAGARLS